MKNLNQSNIKKSDGVFLKPNAIKVLTEDDLKEILQVSFVKFVDNESNQLFEIVPSQAYLCPRCRLYQAKMENELCHRCEKVVNNL